ncbi:MAG: hypothetical protein MZU84_07240 [Sphingobacterium sp.]|nr:hypothetical protein [Sphingobacterium sp.]
MVIGGYAVYLIIRGTMARDLWNAVILLPLFTIAYYVMDTIILKIMNRKGKIDHEGSLDDVARRMQASKLFGVEDFRRLKISPASKMPS